MKKMKKQIVLTQILGRMMKKVRQKKQKVNQKLQNKK
jgi:hypothetical protein